MTETKCEASNRRTEHAYADPHFFRVVKSDGHVQVECLHHAIESERRGQRTDLILT